MSTRTQDEIERLKLDWAQDPIWDIEDTDGFEANREELLSFRRQKEIESDNRRMIEVHCRAKELGCSPQMAEYIEQLENRIETLSEQVFKLMPR